MKVLALMSGGGDYGITNHVQVPQETTTPSNVVKRGIDSISSGATAVLPDTNGNVVDSAKVGGVIYVVGYLRGYVHCCACACDCCR